MLLNKSRAQDYMERFGIDTLVASSPVNVSYFTDLDCWLYRVAKQYMLQPGSFDRLIQSFAVFHTDGDPSIILGADLAFFAQNSWVKDVRTYGSPSFDFSKTSSPKKRLMNLYTHHNFERPIDALISALQNNGPAHQVTGIDPDGLTQQDLEVLSKKLPNAAIKNAKELIRFVRMVKSAEEFKRMERALEINEKGLKKSIGAARAGGTTGEMVRTHAVYSANRGGVAEHYLYSTSGLGYSSSPHRNLSGNEILTADSGTIFEMYYSDTGNTLSFRSSKTLRHTYQVLRDAMLGAFDVIRPGVKPSHVAGTMKKYLESNGVRNCPAHGHGLGLEMRDYPVIHPTMKGKVSDDLINTEIDIPLEEGMIINLETPLLIFQVASLQIERTVVVTKKGFRPLYPQDREEPIIVG